MVMHTLIFVGKSGSGKGTQVKLLEKYLTAKDPQTPIIGLETGDFLREYFASGTYSSELSKGITNSGQLQPEFVTINMWSNFLLKYMQPNCHLFVDGTPRKFHEAGAFDSAIQFYGRTNPVVLILQAPQDTVKDRLLKRGRADDTNEGIKRRLEWFETEVMSCISYYKTNPRYKVIEINGDQSIEDVHKDIVKALGI